MALPKLLLDVEMIDGTIHENVRVILADMIRHSETAQRHKWPTSIEADQVRATAFYAYAAMTRTGLYDSNRGFDEFCNDVAMIGAEGMDELVDPT